jgi:hypothetical protein
MTTVNIIAQIQGEVAAGPQTQAALDVILAKYSAADLAAAFPQFGNVADYQAAKDKLGSTNNAPAPVPAPPPSPPPIPTATSDTVDIVAQIRGEIASGPQNNQGFLNLILNKYSAADLAQAFPEFGNAADYQAAKDGLPKDLIVPGTLDAEGRLQLVQGTPEFFQAENLSSKTAREAMRRAANDYGLNVDFFIAVGTGPGSLRGVGDPSSGGRIGLEIDGGRIVDITDYFEGLPKSPVAIPLNVPTYGTTTVDTPFRTVTITALPEVARTVNTSEGAIVVDPNSETARFIQWQGSQYDPVSGGVIRDTWARQGISDPYSNPFIVGNAIERIDRADARTALFNQSGVTPPGSQISPWNDPNWPAYQGSNKLAYEQASAALADANVKNQLKAENGWTEADFQSWALNATNPEEAARQSAIASAASGFVIGPGPSTTGLSANGATVVTTTGAVNSQGFATSTVAGVAGAATISIRSIVDDFWNSGAVGSSTPFAGGTLNRTTATDAVFTAADGKKYYVDTRSTPSELSNIPGFREAFNTIIGAAVGPGAAGGLLDAAGGLLDTAGNLRDAAGNIILPSLPVPVIPDLAGIATGFAQGFTDSLPDLPSITGALQLTAVQVAGLAQAAQDTAASLLSEINRLPAAIPDSLSPYITTAIRDASAAAGLTAINDLLVRQNATLQKAKEQATLQARNNGAASTADWRVRLQLAPGATYLYKDPAPGILAPLFSTDGVIFPYTPSIETSYTANYDKYDLVHSNYRGYYYKNSAVNDINIRGTFTAQDTAEAEYMLAVIHFFRSITKMFYGQDALRGAPPPLVYLSGFGDFQFNDHPCLVSNFSYSLPNDVDYIRAWAPNNYGNLFSQRAKTGSISVNPGSASATRLSNSSFTADNGVTIILDNSPPAQSPISQNVNNLTGATYVPTKIEINITLLPTNTRSQVSQQFSVKEFANGNLLKGGFW